jgi:acid phosphatase type 7
MRDDYLISRRKALLALVTPLIAAGCSFDSLLSPSQTRKIAGKFNLSDGDEPMMTLIGSGDAHAKAQIRQTAKTGLMVRAMLEQNPNARAFMVGDLADKGLPSEYALYDSTWGAFKDRTDFQIGNCDLLSDPTGTVFHDYVGDGAGEFGKFYYARTYGSWRCYYLNSQANAAGKLEQTQWLAADLPDWADYHIMAMWHQPRVASVCAHNHKAMINKKPLSVWWNLLQSYGCEFVVSGHSHRYERLAQMLSDGTPSSDGARQFIVGTGGPNPMSILTLHPHNEANAVTRGVMKFDLYADRYEWKFTDVSGVVRDTGVQACRKLIAVSEPPLAG